MKNLIAALKGFFKDYDMYWGILAEIAFVLSLSLIGLVICYVLQRWAS